MQRHVLIFICVINLFSCAELQEVVNQLPESTTPLSNSQVAAGLREALDQGIDKQVSKLTQENGYYKNDLVKILLPEELQKVDKTLRDIGLGAVVDEGLKAINRTAEDAVATATPIFVNAVKDITFNDAKTILLGENDAATRFLAGKTESQLYAEFHPIINNSFKKVGADQLWSNLINKYNSIPFTTRVNPDLTDYVTEEALKGVFKMIAVEEQEIRTNLTSRTTEILRKVFALQD